MCYWWGALSTGGDLHARADREGESSLPVFVSPATNQLGVWVWVRG